MSLSEPVDVSELVHISSSHDLRRRAARIVVLFKVWWRWFAAYIFSVSFMIDLGREPGRKAVVRACDFPCNVPYWQQCDQAWAVELALVFGDRKSVV